MARFYERHKSHSDVDLSVVERFFRFQFVNVYVSILSTAILADLSAAWESPFEFVKKIGFMTPNAAFFFAKLLAFQCGSSPLWLLRAWPLLSRGWKTWTVQPPELPGMMYGWAFPKAMMTFTIFCTFWVFAPLLSAIAFVYFFLISFAFRYLILFVHMPVYESGGQFYYRMIERVLFAISVSNVILFFWFLTRGLTGFALIVFPLPFLVYSFRTFAREAYETPSKSVALDEAVAKVDECVDTVSTAFEHNLYTQPALRDAGSLDVDVELESLLHLEEDAGAPPPASPAGDAGAAARRRAKSYAAASLFDNMPDALKPHEASREERRRVSVRLTAAYKGEVDFFDHAADDVDSSSDDDDAPLAGETDDDESGAAKAAPDAPPPPPPIARTSSSRQVRFEFAADPNDDEDPASPMLRTPL